MPKTACAAMATHLDMQVGEMLDKLLELGIVGITMVPTLLGTCDQKQHEYLYWEFHEQGGKQAVRWGDWKGIRLNVRQYPESRTAELYNLVEDIGEENDLSENHPEIVEQILIFMKEAHIPNHVFPLFD